MYRAYYSSIILALVILVMMGSALWQPGGILLLDYIATPDTAVNPWTNAWFLVPQVLVNIFGFSLGTKLGFLIILALAGYLGILWARWGVSKLALTPSVALEVIGGVFFLMNPFAYERMMVQPVIYLAIILVGYMLYFLCRDGLRSRWIWAGIAGGAALNLSLHTSYMIAILLALFVVFFVRKKSDIVGLLSLVLIMSVLNLNWIVGGMLGLQQSVASIEGFNRANLEAFRTEALAPLDVWGTNTLLYGFWGERYSNHYVSVAFLSSLWYVGGLIVVLLSGYGAYLLLALKKTRKYGYILIIAAISSLIFALGIASPLTEGLTLWMMQYLPFWQGYREPQKWIGILMIAEGILLLVALGRLLHRNRQDQWVSFSALFVVLMAFLIWSPGPLMGYHGQLRLSHIPNEYIELRESLRGAPDAGSGAILALPWHSYIGCGWMGVGTVSNPVSGLLSGLPVISADNIEVGDILYSNSENPVSAQVEGFLRTHEFSDLRGSGIRSILLMRGCANSDAYDWLSDIPECQMIRENEQLVLYDCPLQ